MRVKKIGGSQMPPTANKTKILSGRNEYGLGDDFSPERVTAI